MPSQKVVRLCRAVLAKKVNSFVTAGPFVGMPCACQMRTSFATLREAIAVPI